MLYKTVTYMPLKPPYLIEEIKKELPDYIIDQLIQYPRSIYVSVEAYKNEIVEYLDKYFNIGTSHDFIKKVNLEIDKSEIYKFDYYNIIPRPLEMGREIFGNIVRPTCLTDTCPVGSRLLSPVRITTNKCKTVGFAEIHRPWGQPVELVITSRVKELFDSNGVTGLEYEPCVINDDALRNESEIDPPYIARISRRIGMYAEDIKIGKYICEKHSILMSFQLFGKWISKDDLSVDDFQAIDKIIVNGRVYYFHNHGFIVSRKVLEILLKYKIQGLVDMGFFLGQKFLPVIYISGKTHHKMRLDQMSV